MSYFHTLNRTNEQIIEDLVSFNEETKFFENRDKISSCFFNDNKTATDKMRIYSGSTRICVVCDDWNFVLKANIDRCDKINYNESELFIYDKAVKYGVDEFFAWCQPSVEFYGLKFIAMEFCDVDEDRLSDEISSDSYQNYCRQHGYDPKDVNSEEEYFDSISDKDFSSPEMVMDYVRTKYECNKKFSAFEDFLEKFGVNDCHSGNWGYRGKNLVVTDYAGFCVDLKKWEEE